MKAIYPGWANRFGKLLFILAMTMAGTGLVGSEANPPFEYPVLLDHDEMRIPLELWSVSHNWENGTLLLRVSPEGKVEDWIPLELPHYRLVRNLEIFLSSFQFRPAMDGGVPVPCDVRISLSFTELGIGVVNQTIADHIESLHASMGINLNRLGISPVNKLDHPLQIIEKGKTYVAVDEDGNILDGKVIVEFYVDKDGKPRMLRVPNANNLIIELAAFKTVSGFRFTEPRVRGKPTVVKARIPVILAAK